MKNCQSGTVASNRNITTDNSRSDSSRLLVWSRDSDTPSSAEAVNRTCYLWRQTFLFLRWFHSRSVHNKHKVVNYRCFQRFSLSWFHSILKFLFLSITFVVISFGSRFWTSFPSCMSCGLWTCIWIHFSVLLIERDNVRSFRDVNHRKKTHNTEQKFATHSRLPRCLHVRCCHKVTWTVKATLPYLTVAKSDHDADSLPSTIIVYVTEIILSVVVRTPPTPLTISVYANKVSVRFISLLACSFLVKQLNKQTNKK